MRYIAFDESGSELQFTEQGVAYPCADGYGDTFETRKKAECALLTADVRGFVELTLDRSETINAMREDGKEKV